MYNINYHARPQYDPEDVLTSAHIRNSYSVGVEGLSLSNTYYAESVAAPRVEREREHSSSRGAERAA